MIKGIMNHKPKTIIKVEALNHRSDSGDNGSVLKLDFGSSQNSHCTLRMAEFYCT